MTAAAARTCSPERRKPSVIQVTARPTAPKRNNAATSRGCAGTKEPEGGIVKYSADTTPSTVAKTPGQKPMAALIITASTRSRNGDCS